ncbi:MAG: NAD(P)-binding protein [Clostridia bacterium]|jgi:NADPH-dependent glutamate synthase beta subunit-like oxidoreductase|nr:NAD(P)-binding protein [Clostridia bacterium]
MSRLSIISPNQAQTVVENLYKDVERRIIASPPGICPVDISNTFLKLCHAQTCGKCVPCRVGLTQLTALIDDVLEGNATIETIDLIEKTARVIKNSADCAIGYEAADMVLKGVLGFRDDYIEHIVNKRCLFNIYQPVPCVSLCPAGVDIPGYIALISEGRYADAVRLIRKDNPFPTTCALVCEHPCEARCRRNMIDDSVNIRALKRFAVDHSGYVPAPENMESTGKNVAIIGGGPSGLSAAYYLSLMGHHVEVFEKLEKLGGMLRYGIPSYRLPRERLQEDIDCILSTGVTVHTGIEIGKDIKMSQLKENFDCIYISIGAHQDKKIGIEGEDKRGVISAVEMLRNIGNGTLPDFTKKRVIVVGGGNVAMDCTRSAKRLGAESVICVYRRRRVDMTALPDEVDGAISEGCEIMCLQAPIRISGDEDGNVTALWVQPQIAGDIDKSGRPRPAKADAEPIRLSCDIVIAAVGQGTEIRPFEEFGVKVKRGTIDTLSDNEITNIDGIFAGGDCVTGPATVIRAIAAGKVAAANIDEYLGFRHEIKTDVDIPDPRLGHKPACGRMNTSERTAGERNSDFNLIECGLTTEEAMQESRRCLRCDHYGYGIFKGGRVKKW